ncbi:related to succinate-semialdehyde dehydrogenase [Cephalotrichum gorgonifer]|uniref:succinate-semialdehyde dehydrogenase [NAD(P)(+)] n=1 Tax=Cephalotrichum gorgonifer TaxID=2041049 RepID=A0AAE8N7S2_9PEZI|nr:related to succinate-semialdehyde dehydrogenase [Cephalotrichum gorgonifer]
MPSFVSLLRDPSLVVEKAYINGQWVSSKSGKTFQVRNPATGEVLGSCPESDTSDLSDAIEAASAAFPSWRAQSGRARSRILHKFFDLIFENKVDIGTIITAENGKARADAEGEAIFSAGFFEWFAEEAPRLYGDVVPHSNPGMRTQVLKQPIGVCGLITPWNFPMAMGARKIAAALAAGCTVVLKSDGLTPFSSNALAVLSERSGMPKGVLNVVTALENTARLGVAMCDSNVVKKISFTGSTRVGKLLMRQSSGTLKKLSLELGGIAPFIVFDDADIETAVSSALASKFKVSGQTCVCANRIYVQDGIYDKFCERLVQEARKFRVGNGAQNGVTHGPMTTGVAKVEEHVKDAVEKKASVLLGGNCLPNLGENFFELTIIAGVDDTMKVMREETFGPLAAIARFKTEDEVIARANNVEVGLASYVMTSDLSRYYRVSERLEFGMVAVNTGVISDSAAPFGGVKHSGFGREGSRYGCDDYMVYKTVVTGGINTLYSSRL